MKTVLVAGLGLIGGSMAKALKAYTDAFVYGYDDVANVEQMALESGAIDAILEDGSWDKVDLVIVVMYPMRAIAYMNEIMPKLKPKTVMVDLIGVKEQVIKEVAPIAKLYDVSFIGGHPMAGLAKASFERSFAELYQGANMILVPTQATQAGDLEKIATLMRQVGFGHIQYCDEVLHDQMIAHTSQLAHVVSNSYVKSKVSASYTGFCGGSYGDMTRIACLNEKVWSELFLLNKDALLAEIETLLSNISKVKEAIQAEDRDQLEQLLKAGRECKEEIDVIRELN